MLVLHKSDAMLELGYMKILGERFSKSSLIPKVENFSGGVQVTIKRTKFMQMTNVVSLSQVQLTDRQKKMVNLIKDNPFISAQEMSVVLSVVHRTIQRDLATMQKLGVLIREGNTSAGHWVIIQK